MENKIIKLENPKKYSLKLHRNSTLDSTKSSFSKQIKIKLYEKLTPLIDINKNIPIKQKLDFPLFMSLFVSKSTKKITEENNKSSNNKKLILKKIKNYSSNDVLKSNQNIIKNALILQKSQNSISKNRYDNGVSNDSSKQLNLNSYNYNNKIKKLDFQPSKNISRLLLKKINQTNLFNFNQRQNPNIKLFKAKKFELSSIKNTKTYNFETSKINQKKNFFEEIKLTLIKNNNRIIELSNKLQNDINKKKEDKKSNSLIKQYNNSENKQIKEVFEKVNKNEIKIKINNNKKEDNNEIKKNIPVEKIIKNPIINNKKNKTSSILLKRENNDTKVILDLKEQKTLNLQDCLNQKSEESNTYTSGCELSSNLRNKYQIISQNKKVNKVYKKYKFLHKLNEELPKIKNNDKINSKISLNKEKVITNIKHEIDYMIIKENYKNIKQNNLFLTMKVMQNEMLNYSKEIFLNKNQLILYEEAYLILLKRSSINLFNCIIGSVTRDYIYKKYESSQESLTDKLKNNETKENNLIFNKEKFISSNKRNNTISSNEYNNNSNKKNSQNMFKLEKSKNNKIYFNNTKKSLIFIHEMILKSLPFYKENYLKFIINFQNKNIDKIISNISPKKSIMRNKFSFLSKQNSLNPLNSKVYERRNTIKKNPPRRSSSFLKLETIRKTIKIQTKLKSGLKGSNFSVLEKKDFFKKIRSNNNNIGAIGEKDSSSHEKNEVNEIDSQLESIYFQLIKAVYDGKNKFFINFFNQNKKIIDINQIVLEGNTLLLLAVREGNYQITKFLCEENADVNIQNNEGNTALHYAIGKHFYSIADILTMHGAKEDLLNLKGYSPWDCIEHAVE